MPVAGKRGILPAVLARSKGRKGITPIRVAVENRLATNPNIQAQRRDRVARQASGEQAIVEFMRTFDAAIAEIAGQDEPSARLADMAQRVLQQVDAGRRLAAPGRPDTMPEEAWFSFLESLDAGEELALLHIEAWQTVQRAAAGAEEPSHFGRNAAVAAGIAVVLGGIYWWSKRRHNERS